MTVLKFRVHPAELSVKDGGVIVVPLEAYPDSGMRADLELTPPESEALLSAMMAKLTEIRTRGIARRDNMKS